MDHELLALGLLKLQKMHGYQLSDVVDRRLSHLTDLKKATLYNILARAEAQGFVTKTVSRAGNRPERFIFQLTPHGQARFQELLRANLQRAHAAYFADDIGLLFLSELPAAQARALLAEKRASVARTIAELERAVARHEPNTPAYYTLRHHLLHLRTERAWLAELMRSLKQRSVRQDILACLDAADAHAAAPRRKKTESQVQKHKS